MKISTALIFGLTAGVALTLTVACTVPNEPVPTPSSVATPMVEDTPIQEETQEEIQEDEPIQEDDPAWDCRFDGNERCGVEIQGVTYVIQFRDGSPESVGYPSNY